VITLETVLNFETKIKTVCYTALKVNQTRTRQNNMPNKCK